MSHYTSWDYKHLWLCLNHLVVYESDNGIKLYSDTSFKCLCGVAGCACWDLAWGHSASSLLPVVPQISACSSLTSCQFSCKARLDWRVGWSHYLKDSLHSLRITCVCLSLIQFHIQNDKIVYLTLWANFGPTLTIWSWFRWGGLLPESQRLHGWFWRKTASSSARCLGFGFLFGL